MENKINWHELLKYQEVKEFHIIIYINLPCSLAALGSWSKIFHSLNLIGWSAQHHIQSELSSHATYIPSIYSYFSPHVPTVSLLCPPCPLICPISSYVLYISPMSHTSLWCQKCPLLYPAMSSHVSFMSPIFVYVPVLPPIFPMSPYVPLMSPHTLTMSSMSLLISLFPLYVPMSPVMSLLCPLCPLYRCSPLCPLCPIVCTSNVPLMSPMSPMFLLCPYIPYVLAFVS